MYINFYINVYTCTLTFSDIGGLPDRPDFGHGLEYVELSLRTWLCGGHVLRQPCSRIAYPFRKPGSIVGTGEWVNQYCNVMQCSGNRSEVK